MTDNKQNSTATLYYKNEAGLHNKRKGQIGGDVLWEGVFWAFEVCKSLRVSWRRNCRQAKASGSRRPQTRQRKKLHMFV